LLFLYWTYRKPSDYLAGLFNALAAGVYAALSASAGTPASRAQLAQQ
jgi:hypothetical protein